MAAALISVGVGMAVFGWTEWRTFSSEKIALSIAAYQEIDNRFLSALEDYDEPLRARTRYMKSARRRGQVLLAAGCSLVALGGTVLLRRP